MSENIKEMQVVFNTCKRVTSPLVVGSYPSPLPCPPRTPILPLRHLIGACVLPQPHAVFSPARAPGGHVVGYQLALDSLENKNHEMSEKET